MSSSSLSIIGTDFIGLSLAQTFVQEHEPEKLSLIGERPSEPELEALDNLFSDESSADLSRFPEAFEGEKNIRSVVTKTIENLDQTLGFLGGKLVDLKVGTDGFVLLLQDQQQLREHYTHNLVVTAPPLLDVLPNGLPLPGTDSAVTGLLLDKTGLEFHASTDLYTCSVEGEEVIWDLDFGFETNESGGTSNMKISVTGQASKGPTSAEILKKMVEAVESLPEPTTHYNEGFDKEGWEDTSMPEGFVETKTGTLCELLGEVLDNPGNTEELTQRLEGLAGEIDSYSRFRSDPDLQRLRWKTLAAMNFAKPFLTSDQTVNV